MQPWKAPALISQEVTPELHMKILIKASHACGIFKMGTQAHSWKVQLRGRKRDLCPVASLL